MPLRAGHIPHHSERIALQKMSATKGLPLEGLYPVGKNTIDGMIVRKIHDRMPVIIDAADHQQWFDGAEDFLSPTPQRR